MKVYIGISLLSNKDHVSQHEAGLKLLSTLSKDYFKDTEIPPIVIKPSGRPCFAETNNFCDFNISHSEKTAVCVLSDCKTGCDIQYTGKKKAPFNVAERFFHQAENDYILEPANIDERIKRFYYLWTLKESFIKFHGSSVGEIKNTPIFTIKPPKIKFPNYPFFYLFESESTENGSYIFSAAFSERPKTKQLSFKWYSDEKLNFRLIASSGQ